eukprot:TRINITY_DN4469_c1_g1_i1.p1 TRINITY_DN4469_c1_g1~~TRINITY_DN4469_c1_g1_i1.p1  ORF type:complete len:394 (-),score=47.92 TRINITY_DN4469_c1_g1_i1:80-1261(-)
MDKPMSLECPVCQKTLSVTMVQFNQHIDSCLSMTFLETEATGGGVGGGGGGGAVPIAAPAPLKTTRHPSSPTQPVTTTTSDMDHSDTPSPADSDAELDDWFGLGMCERCTAQDILTSGLCSSCLPPQNRNSHPLKCSDSNPFKVLCPYPLCPIQQMEAYRFPGHAVESHSSCVQNLACPVCYLSSGSTYNPTSNTNLLEHIRATHSDMLLPAYPPSDFSDWDSKPRATKAPRRGSGRRPSPSYSLPTTPSGTCSSCGVNAGHLTTCVNFKRADPSTHMADIGGDGGGGGGDGNMLQEMGWLFGSPTPTARVDTTTTTTTTSIINKAAIRFVEETLKDGHSLTNKECEICYENFAVNDVVARLECFCTYHTTCVSVWFKKAGGNKCPLHSQDAI